MAEVEFVFLLWVLGVEPRASCMLSTQSTTSYTPSPRVGIGTQIFVLWILYSYKEERWVLCRVQPQLCYDLVNVASYLMGRLAAMWVEHRLFGTHLCLLIYALSKCSQGTI